MCNVEKVEQLIEPVLVTRATFSGEFSFILLLFFGWTFPKGTYETISIESDCTLVT